MRTSVLLFQLAIGICFPYPGCLQYLAAPGDGIDAHVQHGILLLENITMACQLDAGPEDRPASKMSKLASA